MNRVKATVKEIVGEPKEKYKHWFLTVKFDSHGKEGETDLMFDTKEQAEQIEVGYEFKI